MQATALYTVEETRLWLGGREEWGLDLRSFPVQARVLARDETLTIGDEAGCSADDTQNVVARPPAHPEALADAVEHSVGAWGDPRSRQEWLARLEELRERIRAYAPDFNALESFLEAREEFGE